jgi:ligand-binding SRPBCC domain-containing protein
MTNRANASKHTHIFKTSMILSAGIEDVFAFFSNAKNLERITPKELCFRILTPQPITMQQHTTIDYQLKLYGLPFRWRACITTWDPPHTFVDAQEKGPYRTWIHTHQFRTVHNGTEIIDQVLYRLPFLPVGEVFHPLIAAQIERIFAFRQATITHIFQTRNTQENCLRSESN